MHPLVTVLFPVYNAEDYVSEAIQSILHQSFRDFKLLLINDGSTDRSEDIMAGFKDDRIQYIKNPKNLGLIGSLNIGLELVDTQYIIRMDADDISHHDRFRLLVEFMEQNPDFGICGTAVGDLAGPIQKVRVMAEPKLRAMHLLNCAITHASAIYRTSLFKEKGFRYNEKYKHAEDNDLITNIALVSRVAVLDHKLYWVRKHEHQVSNKYSPIQRASSNIRRIELMEHVTGVKLGEADARLYQALSYKEGNLTISDFQQLPSFMQTLLAGYANQKHYVYDASVLTKLLYKRVTLLYFKNASLGLALWVNYLKNFLSDKQISIGFRLFLKTLLNRK